jgi:NAD(P)-dependent dehydrogenase (short-subunit alcohol dehydrogenase family)
MVVVDRIKCGVSHNTRSNEMSSRPSNSRPTWLITGCSSGLGRQLAEAVLARGWNAAITARQPASLQDLVAKHPDTALALALDVTDGGRIVEVVRRTEGHFGGVDVLVNNAGHGYRGAVEEASDSELAELFATNFFGPVALIKAVLPGMRTKRHGTIVNISSMAAFHAAPGSGFYSATKCALQGMSDGLRKEVGPLGIKVMVVAPGPFRTDFTGRSLMQSATPIPDYADTAGRRRKERDTEHGNQPGNPARAAQVMIDMVESGAPPFFLLLGKVAVRVVRTALDDLRVDIDRWEKVSVSTDYETQP